jgi:hypothetical protein
MAFMKNSLDKSDSNISTVVAAVLCVVLGAALTVLAIRSRHINLGPLGVAPNAAKEH